MKKLYLFSILSAVTATVSLATSNNNDSLSPQDAFKKFRNLEINSKEDASKKLAITVDRKDNAKIKQAPVLNTMRKNILQNNNNNNVPSAIPGIAPTSASSKNTYEQHVKAQMDFAKKLQEEQESADLALALKLQKEYEEAEAKAKQEAEDADFARKLQEQH